MCYNTIGSKKKFTRISISHLMDKLMILFFPCNPQKLHFPYDSTHTHFPLNIYSFIHSSPKISFHAGKFLTPATDLSFTDGHRNFFILLLNTHSIFSKQTTNLFFHSLPYFQFHFQNGYSVLLFCLRFGNKENNFQ
jgi:hypothetical protein